MPEMEDIRLARLFNCWGRAETRRHQPGSNCYQMDGGGPGMEDISLAYFFNCRGGPGMESICPALILINWMGMGCTSAGRYQSGTFFQL